MVRITLDKPYIPIPVPVTAIKYGLLYNWYAATDVRNIAAAGWIVPTKTNFETLQTYLGGQTVSGSPLKEVGLTYWDSDNDDATNSAKFNGRGSFRRENTGSFAAATFPAGQAYYFTQTPNGAAGAISFVLSSSNTQFSLSFRGKKDGQAIRLLKTTTTLSDGQTGTYTGNDGKVYRTICIGTQEWLADNLCETKYRNGDTIPEVTDNSAWAALTTGALCAYNNDWDNV